jgi:hypothetical protein
MKLRLVLKISPRENHCRPRIMPQLMVFFGRKFTINYLTVYIILDPYDNYVPTPLSLPFNVVMK